MRPLTLKGVLCLLIGHYPSLQGNKVVCTRCPKVLTQAASK